MKTFTKFIGTRAFLKRNLSPQVCSQIGWGAGTNQEVTGWRPEQRAVLLGGDYTCLVPLKYISSIRDYYISRKVKKNKELITKFNEDVTADYLADCD